MKTGATRTVQGRETEPSRPVARKPHHPTPQEHGEGVPSADRAFFEERFGFDFSQVRIHHGPRAAEAADSVHARAFTVGRDIVFGDGQYTPGSPGGRRLLAHELAHVVQQSRSAPASPHRVSQAGDPAEAEADRSAEAVMSGGRAGSLSPAVPGLQRKPLYETGQLVEAAIPLNLLTDLFGAKGAKRLPPLQPGTLLKLGAPHPTKSSTTFFATVMKGPDEPTSMVGVVQTEAKPAWIRPHEAKGFIGPPLPPAPPAATLEPMGPAGPAGPISIPAKPAAAAASHAPSEEASAAPSGTPLPEVALTLAESYEILHQGLARRIDAISDAAGKLHRLITHPRKEGMKETTLPMLRSLLENGRLRAREAETAPDEATKSEKLRQAGLRYQAALVVTQIVEMRVNVLLVADAADEMGQDSDQIESEITSYEDDMLALTEAALSFEEAKLVAAMPGGLEKLQRWVGRLDEWILALGKGAKLSKKVIQIADLVMIAISIYQVAKIPVVSAGGGSAGPPTIAFGTSGGVAAAARFDAVSMAAALESIRKLIAIGALDASVIAGLSRLGGGSDTALPELQRPEAMQMSGGGGGPFNIPGKSGLKGHESLSNETRGAGDSGGHTIRKHVGKDAQELAERLATEDKKGAYASSYSDEDTAERLINKGLKARATEIREWLKTAAKGDENHWDIKFDGEKTGIVVRRGVAGTVDGKGIRIWLVCNPNRSGGFFILTSHPIP